MNRKTKSPNASVVGKEKLEGRKKGTAEVVMESESFSFSPDKQKSALSLADILTSVTKLSKHKTKPFGKTLTSLYDRAKDIAEKKEQKSQAIFKESHPFRPKLNKLSEKMIETAKIEGIDLHHSKLNKKYQPQPSPIEEPKEVKRLSMTHFVEKYNSQIMRYKEKPKGEPFVSPLDRVDNNCTFSPNLDRKSIEIAKKSQIDVYSKTVRDNKLKLEKMNKFQTIKETEELASCTFSPKIIRNYSKSPRPSLQLREKNFSRGYSRNSTSANRSRYNISCFESSEINYQ